MSKSLRIFIPKVSEFESLAEVARQRPNCKVSEPLTGYRMVESDVPQEFGRKELGLKPAIWYGLFTGGLSGRIERFDRNTVRIVPAD